MIFKRLYNEIYETAKKNGFWDEKNLQNGMLFYKELPLFIEFINKINVLRGDTHLEVSECLEKRIEQIQNDDIPHIFDDDIQNIKLILILTEVAEAITAFNEENFQEEIADIFIRLMDLILKLQEEGFDIETAIDDKMEKNKSRPYLHGKKC